MSTETRTILINVYSASNLPKADPTGLSDPYCIIQYDKLTSKGFIKNDKQKTETIKENLNPIWNDSFILKHVLVESEIVFNVFDWDNVFKFSSDDFLGEFKLKVEDIPMNEKKVWNVPIHDNLNYTGQLYFATMALPNQDVDKKNEKELKSKVSLRIDELKLPMMTPRYHNRVEITLNRTMGFVDDKEKRNIFAQVKIGKQILETPVWKSKGNPFWNTDFSFAYKTSNELMVIFKDWKFASSKENLGSCLITLTDIKMGEEIEKELPIQGSQGKLLIKLKIIQHTQIEETIPFASEFDFGEDDWCKQNIQFFESFHGKPNLSGIISTSDEQTIERYNFETKRDDISNIISDELFGFNDNYFEKPIINGILKSWTKRAFYNSIKTEKGHILVIVGSETSGMYKAVAISKMGKIKIYIKSIEKIDRDVMNLYGLKKEQVSMVELPYDIWDSLKEYEESERKPQYKFGIVVAQKGQSTEMEFLANTKISPDCEQFFELIGKKIEVQGYTGYNGKLDVVEGRSGKYSIVSNYKNNDIMFHVSTYLLHEETDTQFIAKKRHIGNDVVVIVFKETNDKKDDEIKLESFKSQYNHIYIIVSPVIIKKQPMYRVAVCCKKPVAAFLPRFPEEQYFPRDQSFVNWLLEKCINAERAALESPKFMQAPIAVNEGFLERVLKKAEMK